MKYSALFYHAKCFILVFLSARYKKRVVAYELLGGGKVCYGSEKYLRFKGVYYKNIQNWGLCHCISCKNKLPLSKPPTSMIKEKTYRYDDTFKAQARKHQFDFRENELNDFYDAKNPQVILTPGATKKGLIFCDSYRELIRSKVEVFKASALFSNMLRSEHIPYNIFTPMEEDLGAAVLLFNEIIGGGISTIEDICIEFAGEGKRDEYLNDGTSFDTFIKYKSTDGKVGGIGIEVKYTEKGYRIGKKEEDDIKEVKSKYHQKTQESGYFIPSLDVLSFIKANHLRQIWRNHILGYAMLHRGEIQYFHHVHLYPEGNTHFHEHAIPEYLQLLTEKGEKTFIALTFEKLFTLLSKYFTSPKQMEWQDYLHRRYIVPLPPQK